MREEEEMGKQKKKRRKAGRKKERQKERERKGREEEGKEYWVTKVCLSFSLYIIWQNLGNFWPNLNTTKRYNAAEKKDGDFPEI